MKTNNSLVNGGSAIDPSTDARYYQAYALYFQKYVQAYAQNNIPIDFVVPQNEPGYPAPFGSTLWTSAQEANFVANYLGPQFQNNNVAARIRIFEWNRDQWTFPKQVLDNSATAPYVAGVDWHNYDCLNSGPSAQGCMPDNVQLFNDSHPGYSMWMSEYTSINTAPHQNYLDGENWGNIIMTDVGNGEGGWIFWNMILDQNGGPFASASGPQDSLVEIDTSTSPPAVDYLPKFWYLAQFSTFVRPGAYRISADGGVANDGLRFLAFKNSDGSEVLVVMNTNGSAVQIKVREDGNYDLLFRVASLAGGGQLSLDMDGTGLVGTQSVPSTGGWENWTTVPAYGVILSQGVHTFTFHAVTEGFNLHDIFFKKVHRLDTLPTVIQAEWYAGGGEGEGYHDTTAGDESTKSYPGYYRAEDVDLEISSTGNYDVGHIDTGEWLRYDEYNPNSSSTTYTLTFSVASATGGGQIRVDLDSVGNTIGATQSVPNTGGWQAWQNLSETITLPSGTHAVYFYLPAGGFNLDYFQLS